jgi:hypothetical protein
MVDVRIPRKEETLQCSGSIPMKRLSVVGHGLLGVRLLII